MVFHSVPSVRGLFISIAVLSTLVACGGGGGGGGATHNHAPVAGFEATPVTGQTPLEVSFDASASSDEDGDFLTYEWVFGDGGTASSASPLYTHVYNAVGTHTATLTVSDGKDASATTEVEVVVSAAPPPNQEPVASLSADPLEGNAPLTVSFDASASTDADNDTLSYAWEFGDGQTAEGASPTIDHEFSEAGEFTATVTVSDGNGGEDQASALVEVSLAPSGYTIIDLGTFGGVTSQAHSINNAGQIVGMAMNAGGDERPFLYSGGVLQDLGTLGGNGANAYGINDNGDIVGTSNLSNGGNYFAFLKFSGNAMVNLGALTYTWSRAYDVNDNGDIVGSLYSSQWGSTFLYSNGVMSDLGKFGGLGSAPTRINNSGEIIGSYFIDGIGDRAFSYAGGIFTPLGTLGGTQSRADGINDAGDIVGCSETAGNASSHVFLYRDGEMTDLGNLGGSGFNDIITCGAFAINGAGHVVGRSTANGDPASRAFLYKDSLMIDLNTFLSQDSPWLRLHIATDINDQGQIVGTGILKGDGPVLSHAFLMTPNQ